MTKADLIEEVSRVVEMTRKESEVIVEAIFDSIVRSLRTGDKIEIRGFGSFRTRQRQPRIGRNPKTGARVEVPGYLGKRGGELPLAVGQESDFKIVKMSEVDKKIGLSLRAAADDEEKTRLVDYQRNAAAATTTIEEAMGLKEPEPK